MALSAMTAQEKYRSVFGEKETFYTMLYTNGSMAITDTAFYLKDTVVDDMAYKLFYLGRQGAGLANWHEKYIIYETEDKSQIYGKRIFTNIGNNRDTTKEYLIMDLNLEIGDTFVIYEDGKNSDTITVKSIYWDDAGLKHIVFDYEVIYGSFNFHSKDFEFVEGIGTNASLFYQGLQITTYGPGGIGLLCAFKDGAHIYQNDQSEECYYTCFVTGLPEEDDWSHVTIYPNPAQTSFTIDFAIDDQFLQIDILNLQGQCVKTISTSQSRQAIDVADLSNGVYLVRFVSKGEKLYKKLIIIK